MQKCSYADVNDFSPTLLEVVGFDESYGSLYCPFVDGLHCRFRDCGVKNLPHSGNFMCVFIGADFSRAPDFSRCLIHSDGNRRSFRQSLLSSLDIPGL